MNTIEGRVAVAPLPLLTAGACLTPPLALLGIRGIASRARPILARAIA